MSWLKRFAAGVVAAMRCAQQEDPEFAAGFERRIEALIAREIPLAAALPPAPPDDAAAWDRPSEQTVRVVLPARPPAADDQPRATMDATRLRAAAR